MGCRRTTSGRRRRLPDPRPSHDLACPDSPDSRFHVFLPHNSADKPAVEALAGRLRAEGLEPWLDLLHVIPGDPWLPAIEKALGQCASVAVCVGPSDFGPWQHEEMRVAIGRRVSAGRASLHPGNRALRWRRQRAWPVDD
ncbi:MAG TPA: toll/interleukin-1 receptor domain-containing protein [Gemmataceae bacterium]|nr:toll/interleukin-1 receptor domain-containing protein [Gemmataceae bacterium]